MRSFKGIYSIMLYSAFLAQFIFNTFPAAADICNYCTDKSQSIASDIDQQAQWHDLSNYFSKSKSTILFSDAPFAKPFPEILIYASYESEQSFKLKGLQSCFKDPSKGKDAKLEATRFYLPENRSDFAKMVAKDGLEVEHALNLSGPYIYRLKITAPDSGYHSIMQLTSTAKANYAAGQGQVQFRNGGPARIKICSKTAVDQGGQTGNSDSAADGDQCKSYLGTWAWSEDVLMTYRPDGTFFWHGRSPTMADKQTHTGSWQCRDASAGIVYHDTKIERQNGCSRLSKDGNSLHWTGRDCSRNAPIDITAKRVEAKRGRRKSAVIAPPSKGLRILQRKMVTWSNSQTDYARISKDDLLTVGMGNSRWGYGFAGLELDGIGVVSVSVGAPASYSRFDANSFAGFLVDYHTGNGYTHRVVLGIGLLDNDRFEKRPSWGSYSTGDQFVDLGIQERYHIDFNRWAPKGWDGKLWFTLGLQNAGFNNELTARLEIDQTFTSGQKDRANEKHVTNSHAYRLSDDTKTWSEARRACAAQGGHLATISSQLENDFLHEKTSGKRVWIGGSDAEQEGQWRWITGEPWRFTNWGDEEPNDSEPGEDYLELSPNGQWNDDGQPRNNREFHYLCEWDDETDLDSARAKKVAGLELYFDRLIGTWKGQSWCISPKDERRPFNFTFSRKNGRIYCNDHSSKNTFSYPANLVNGQVECVWSRDGSNISGTYHFDLPAKGENVLRGSELVEGLHWCRIYKYELQREEREQPQGAAAHRKIRSKEISWDLIKPNHPSPVQNFQFKVPVWARQVSVKINHGYDDTGDHCAKVTIVNGARSKTINACSRTIDEVVIPTDGRGDVSIFIADHDTSDQGSHPGNGGSLWVEFSSQSVGGASETKAPLSTSKTSSFEYNTNRSGNNYKSYKDFVSLPSVCQAKCNNDERCSAWTYVRPGQHGPKAECWLKNPTPKPTPNDCCISGKKGASN